MMCSVIAETAAGFGALLVGVAAEVFIIALVIICLIRASRYFMNAGKEQKLTRIEIGKLAEEVRILREELKAQRP
jgi:uncharacterized membrane protein